MNVIFARAYGFAAGIIFFILATSAIIIFILVLMNNEKNSSPAIQNYIDLNIDKRAHNIKTVINESDVQDSNITMSVSKLRVLVNRIAGRQRICRSIQLETIPPGPVIRFAQIKMTLIRSTDMDTRNLASELSIHKTYPLPAAAEVERDQTTAALPDRGCSNRGAKDVEDIDNMSSIDLWILSTTIYGR
jgi:hypothetical protein